MIRQTSLLAVVLFVALWQASAAHAQKRDVLVVEKWSGSVADETLKKDAPQAITSAAQLKKIWAEWKAEGAAPKVDFDKFLVVAVYSSGSKLNLAGAKLDDQGNLEVLAISTRDLRPGFRYVLGQVSNDGVKTINGKKLPDTK